MDAFVGHFMNSIGYKSAAVIPLLNAFEALHIAGQLLDALEYLHSRGIIHCGVNPRGLIVDVDKRVRLFDFGMSMTEDEAAFPSESRVGRQDLARVRGGGELLQAGVGEGCGREFPVP